MGLNLSGISPCHQDTPVSTIRPGNPNPARFELQHVVPVGAHVVVQARWPDAANYEGVKVLLYRNTTAAQIRAAGRLDPHFCDDGHLSPFARFEPSEAGRLAAVALAPPARRDDGDAVLMVPRAGLEPTASAL